MAKFRSIKNAFISGQISPKALGRTDLQQYANACEVFENAIPYTTGGFYRRPGTNATGKVNGAVNSSSSALALYPFVFSKDQSALMYYQVDGTGTFDLGLADIYGSLSFSSVTDPGWRANTTSTTVPIPGYDQYLSMQTVQSADVMWMVNPNTCPYIVQRSGGIGAYTYTGSPLISKFTGQTLVNSVPFGRVNTTAIKITPSGTTGTITLTVTGGNLFDAKHVGALFKLKQGTVGGVLITGVTSPTVATATVLVTLGGSGSAVSDWWESEWSDYRGWPRAIAFYGKRLVYGGNAAYPDRLWFSKKNDYFVMQNTATLDPYEESDALAAFTSELPSTQVNEINWLIGGTYLFCGTAGAEFTISTVNGLLDKTNISIVKQSSNGSAYVAPAQGGNELFFVSQGGDSIVALVYNNDEQSYRAEPVQILFDEYPQLEEKTVAKANRQIRKISWDETRKILWCLDTNGNFFGCSRDRVSGILAWYKHTFGGTDKTDRISEYDKTTVYFTDPAYQGYVGYVTSFALTFNNQTGFNDIHLSIIRKNYTGTYSYAVETIEGNGDYQISNKGYDPYNTASTPLLLDRALVWNDYVTSNPAANIPLPNDEFTGGTYPGVVVNKYGIFEIPEVTVTEEPTPASYYKFNMPTPYPTGWGDGVTKHFIAIGTKFRTTVKPVRLEAGSQIGSAQGAIKKIHKLLIRFYKSMTCSVGRDLDHLEELNFREGDTPMQESADLFTGDKVITFDSDYDRDGYLVLTTDRALPMNVISVVAEGVTYD